MSVTDQVLRILRDPLLNSEDSELTVDEELLNFVETTGWLPVSKSLVEILQNESLKADWSSALTALFCCDFHTRELPAEPPYLIALFYDCLERFPKADQFDFASNSPGVDENLVWSLTTNLKGISYESKYDPWTDPDVQRQVIDR